MPGRSQPAAVAIEVSRLNALLRAAEDEIIRLRCEREDGREGVWGRRGDRAGLKERVEGGGKGYGPLVFIKASSLPALLPPEVASTDIALPQPTLTTSLLDMPNEILRQIVDELHHPPSTAAVCLTSFILYEIAAPVLYHTMHLRHPDQLAPFLSPRPSARYEPTLALDLVRVLYFHPFHLDPDVGSYLSLTFPNVQDLHIYRLPFFSPNIDKANSVLSNLNPTRLFWRCRYAETWCMGGHKLDAAEWDRMTAGWTKLEMMCIVDVMHILVAFDFVEGPGEPHFQPFLNPRARLVASGQSASCTTLVDRQTDV